MRTVVFQTAAPCSISTYVKSSRSCPKGGCNNPGPCHAHVRHLVALEGLEVEQQRSALNGLELSAPVAGGQGCGRGVPELALEDRSRAITTLHEFPADWDAVSHARPLHPAPWVGRIVLHGCVTTCCLCLSILQSLRHLTNTAPSLLGTSPEACCSGRTQTALPPRPQSPAPEPDPQASGQCWQLHAVFIGSLLKTVQFGGHEAARRR